MSGFKKDGFLSTVLVIKRLKAIGILPVILMFSAMVTSCRLPSESYFKEVDPQGWDAAMCLDYNLKGDSLNPEAKYALQLSVRYRAAGADSLIRLTIDREITADSIHSHNITIHLIDRHRGPLGRGMYGLYIVTVPLAEDVKIDKNCNITVSPQQDTPEVHGVMAVGISALKH